MNLTRCLKDTMKIYSTNSYNDKCFGRVGVVYLVVSRACDLCLASNKQLELRSQFQKKISLDHVKRNSSSVRAELKPEP